jgi:hypothetical protein
MWEGTLMNSFIFKCESGTKKEGTQTEFHEFLGCVWLEFLLKQGLHDNTFQLSNIVQRLRQFSNLVTYDKMSGLGPIAVDNKATAMDTSNTMMDNSKIGMIAAGEMQMTGSKQ